MATCEMVTGPADLPVGLEELKSHLQEVSNDQDGYLADLLKQACEDATKVCNGGLGTATYRYTADRFPCWPTLTGEVKPITLPVRPGVSVVSVKYYDEDDVERTLDPDDYWFDGQTGRIVTKDAWPDTMPGRPGAVSVTFTAGFTAENLPLNLKRAVLLIAANYYRQRGDGDNGVEVPIPPAANRLLWQLWNGDI